MLFENFFQEDLKLFNENLSELKRLVTQEEEFMGFVEKLEKEDNEYATRIKGFQSRLVKQCERATVVIDRMRSKPSENDLLESYGLYLVVTVHSLQPEVQSFQDFLMAAQTVGQLNSQSPPSQSQTKKQGIISRIIGWVQQHVVPILRRVLQGAWQILSNLLTPKGWKVKGSIRTSFLSLANAELEITFGK